MVRRTVRWGAALGLGAVWWWAVLRIALREDPGLIEGAVAIGGWGLSVLPVHCVPKGRAAGAVAAGRWGTAWRAEDAGRAWRERAGSPDGTSNPDGSSIA